MGEHIAASFLVRRGAAIVSRNLRLWPGEIDLLVDWQGALVAVEVKTRVGADPVEGLTDAKADALRRSGSRLEVRPRRYDLIAVRLDRSGAEVRWLPGAC